MPPDPLLLQSYACNDGLTLEFDDNAALLLLVGDHSRHLVTIEQQLGIRCAHRGNRISIQGPIQAVQHARKVFSDLCQKISAQHAIDTAMIEASIRMTRVAEPAAPDAPVIRTRRGVISPRSPGQGGYMRMLADTDMVFGIGPAGTGKTYLAVAQAVAMLQAGEVDRIILSRPAVEAGERLGFLPGDMKDKIDPYLRPLYDALHDMIPADQLNRKMAAGEIEVAPLAFMRGRTLSHAFAILDEAQNTTSAQMKMFLTRMGSGTRMVITGDMSQVDLPRGVSSGLREALHILHDIPGIGVTYFDSRDVVRHPLVSRIVDAYDHASRPGKM